MKRLPLILLGIAVVAALGFLSGVVTQGFQEMARVEDEKRLLEEEKARLERSIPELEATLDAVRSNPEAVESMARQELGWIRPGEKILMLATPTPQPLAVSLTQPAPTPILTLPE